MPRAVSQPKRSLLTRDRIHVRHYMATKARGIKQILTNTHLGIQRRNSCSFIHEISLSAHCSNIFLVQNGEVGWEGRGTYLMMVASKSSTVRI